MFRKFLIESANQKWFNKFPMPKNVGSFLVAANNLAVAQNDSEIQESIWDDSKGRGFPLNQGAADFMAASPKNSGTMTDAFIWLVTEGLYQATKIRKQLANEFDNPEITEDIIYSPAAWKQFPELLTFLKEKYKQNPYVFEPSSPIEYKVNGQLVSFTLQEVNQFIQEVNNQIKTRSKGSLPNLLQEFHFAPKFDALDMSNESNLGFIEWVENGSWADKSFGTEKDGASWRTRHGISLHSPKKYQQKPEQDQGLLHYEFGDGNIVMPMRELENIRHFMSIFPRKIVADTYKNIQTKIDDIKDPTVKRRVQDIAKAAFKGKYGKTVTHAVSRGQDQTGKKDTFDEAEEFLGNTFLIKLALDVFAKSNNAIYNDLELKNLENNDPKVQSAMQAAIGDEYPGIQPIIRKWPDHRFFVKGGTVYFDWNKPKLADDYFQVSDSYIARAIASIKQGIPYTYNVGKRTNVPMTADLYNSGKRIVHNLDESKIKEKFQSMFGSSLKDDPELLTNSINYVLTNIKSIPDSLEIPAEKVSGSKLGKVFDKSRALSRKELDSLIQDEPYGITKINGEYHVYRRSNDPDAPLDLTGQSGQDPDNLLTPEQKEANAKSGWKVKGGSDVLLNSKRATLMRSGKKIELFRDNPKADWEFYDRQQPMDNIVDKENIPVLTASDKAKFLSSRAQGVGSRDNSERDLKDIVRQIQADPGFYGYSNYQDFEEEVQNLARKNASRTFSYNSRERVGYDSAYAWIYQAMLEWMSNVPEFTSRFGDIDDQSYLKKVVSQAKQSGIDFDKEYGKLIQARKTNDFSSLSQPIVELLTTTGREYRSSQALKGFGKILASQSAEGGLSSKGDDGSDQSFDHSSQAGKAHLDARGFDTKGNRGYSNVTNSFSDVESDEEKEDSVDVLSNMGRTNTLRKERNLEDDAKYISAYRRQYEFINDVNPNDLRALSRIVDSNSGTIVNSMILGKLDATGDKVLDLLKTKFSQESSDLFDFIKNICIPLNQIYLKQHSENLTSHFVEILGDNQLLRKAKMEYDKSQELRPAAKTIQPQPQEPTSSTLQPQEPTSSTLSQNTQQSGQVAPAPVVPVKKGLGSFMKRRTESYSFRTRYLRKLAEMAGATGAVYDGNKDFEGNWEGAVGHPLGVSIKGEVEDRQTNPDGKGKKRGKSK